MTARLYPPLSQHGDLIRIDVSLRSDFNTRVWADSAPEPLLSQNSPSGLKAGESRNKRTALIARVASRFGQRFGRYFSFAA